MESSASGDPILSSATAMLTDTPLASGLARLAKAPRRVRASLPPPSAFTPLNDPPAESPHLPQGPLSALPNRISWQGPFPEVGMSAVGVVGENPMAVSRDRSHSDTDAIGIQTKPGAVDRESTISTSSSRKEAGSPIQNDEAQTRRVSERSLDRINQGLADSAGDAARHANLIMQTRRAKIQKWRPTSAETQKGPFGQEPPGNSVIPRLARTLSVPRLDHTTAVQSESLSTWDFGKYAHATEQLDTSTILLRPSEETPVPRPSGLPITSTDSLSLQVPCAPVNAKGTVALEKSPSSDSNVNGIEWVDWLDEYKKYKEAKIRSEGGSSRSAVTSTLRPSGDQPLMPEHALPLPTASLDNVPDSITSKSSQPSPLSPKQTISQLPSTVDLNPKVEHSVRSQETAPAKISRALSQTGEMLHRTVSRSDAKRHPNSSSSNPSGASLRQTSHTHKGASRKAKGLGNKIEGWWHSVKTNFQNPTVANAPVPKILPFPPKTRDSAERQQSAYAKAIATKVPSAPPSRRGSVMPLHSEVPAQSMAFDDNMRTEALFLRTATSHTDLARLGNSIPTNETTESDRASTSSPIPVPSLPHRQASDPTDGAVKSTLVQHVVSVQRAATGLEARRKQPALSLKLDNHMLSLSLQSRRQQGGASLAPSASAYSSSAGSLGFASRSEQESSGSMPLVSRGWEQTPSPMQALTTRPALNATSGTSPPAGPAGFSKVSVQRHVKHRLTVAKENCDKELQTIISEITAYVEQHIQRERQLASDIPLEEEEEAEEEEDSESVDNTQLHLDYPFNLDSETIPVNLESNSVPASLSRGVYLRHLACLKTDLFHRKLPP